MRNGYKLDKGTKFQTEAKDIKFWWKMGRDVKNVRNVPNAKGTKFCWKAVEDVENKPKVNKLLKNVGRCQKRAEWFQAKIRV